jgi:putative ABC transport system permease protein
MLKSRLIRRQIAGSLHQSVVFVLCVLLSIVTLVSLSGFSRSVHSSSLRDARVLHAADIIIHSHSPFSPGILSALAELERKRAVESARVYTFYSVVRATNREASLLAELKVVEPGYPFYGSVDLASGRPFREALVPGRVVVEQALLDRLRLRPGDRLKVGSALLAIADVVLHEPDRPVNIFALGPRVFVPATDLASIGLAGKGSRVQYTILAKVADQKELDRIAGTLRSASQKERERVETFRSADSGVKRFFDNFLFFLNLIGIFTLLLAGIGIQSSLTAFLKEQERTIAVMKAVGAGSRFIIGHYFAVVAVLGLIGTLAGIGVSFLLEALLPNLFRGLLPASVELAISWGAVLEGFLLGFLVVALFTFLPLYRLKEVRPRAIFGKEEQAGFPSRATMFFTAVVVVFFVVMVLLRIGEMKAGAYFVLGVGLLILAAWLCAAATLRLLRNFRARGLVLRQALKGLFRPGSATQWIMVTLTAALAVIFSITLVEENLDATFVRSYPIDSPNLFFIDIQPGQKDAFARDLGIATTYYPVVRGTVIAVNNVVIDREQERQKRGDNLAREFSLTYREHLLEDERIVAGSGLYRDDWPEPQVSVLDTVLKMRDMRIGDSITFRIQGVPVEARISSIRTRTRASLQPFFYFLFPEKVLKDAPHTLFTALRVDKERIAPLQNRIVSRFPNVSLIDVTEAVAVFSRIMGRLSSIVRFFTLFSIVAGILIIISSVFATRHTRVREAVYFTILGARGRFVVAVFAVENLVIGLASGAIALLLSQAIGWTVCRTALDVAYRPFFGMSLLMVLITTVVVIAVGLGASVPVLRQKPAAFLREQTEE